MKMHKIFRLILCFALIFVSFFDTNAVPVDHGLPAAKGSKVPDSNAGGMSKDCDNGCRNECFRWKQNFGKSLTPELSDGFLVVSAFETDKNLYSPVGLAFIDDFSDRILDILTKEEYLDNVPAIHRWAYEDIWDNNNFNHGVRIRYADSIAYFMIKDGTQDPQTIWTINGQVNINLTYTSDQYGSHHILFFPDGTKKELTVDRQEQITNLKGKVLKPKNSGIDVVYDGNNIIRQVYSKADGLADIVVIDEFKYEIRFYPPANTGAKVNHLYQFTGEPEKVCSFENVARDHTQLDDIRVTETVGAVSYVTDWHYTLPKQWTMTQSSRVTQEIGTYDNDGDRARYIVTYDDDGNQIAIHGETYKYYSWGEAVAKNFEGWEENMTWTEVLLYDEPDNPVRHMKKASERSSAGSWKTFDYDSSGRLAVIKEVFVDAEFDAPADSCILTELSYVPLASGDTLGLGDYRPRTETVKILGKIVAKTFHVYVLSANGEYVEIEEKAINPSSGQFGDIGNLRKTSIFYSGSYADIACAGRLKQEIFADGSVKSYSYETGNYVVAANPAACSFAAASEGESLKTTIILGTLSAPFGIPFKTTKTVHVRNAFGDEVLTETYIHTGSDYEKIDWTVKSFDGNHHITATYKSNGTQEEATWNCCDIASETSTDGIIKTSSYDADKRKTAEILHGLENGSGIKTSFVYDNANRVLSKTVKSLDESVSASSESWTYDIAGRITSHITADGLETIFAYSDGGRITTETLPGGFTRITELCLDGTVKSITGSAVVSEYHSYGVNADGSKWEKVNSVAPDSPFWSKTSYDTFGRKIKYEQTAVSGTVLSTYFYDSQGRLIKTVTGNNPATLYSYDEIGELSRVGTDISSNGVLDPASMDKIYDYESIFEKAADSSWWRVRRSYSYNIDNDSEKSLVSLSKERLSGFSDNLVKETRTYNAGSPEQYSQIFIDRITKNRIIKNGYADTDVCTVETYINGQMTAREARPGINESYTYDKLGRNNSISYSSGLSANITYDSNDRVSTVSDSSGMSVAYSYEQDSGRLAAATNALNETVRYSYNSLGNVRRIWGNANYPLEMDYDAYGRLIALKTFRNGSNWDSATWPDASTGNPDITSWHYHEASGLLLDKTYADNSRVSYAYNSDNRLSLRTWARALETSYGYDVSGLLSAVTYSDSTPALSILRDRTGKIKNLSDGTGTWNMTYESSGLLNTVEIPYITGYSLDNDYDELGRRETLSVKSNGTVLEAQRFSYDAMSRLSSVSSGTVSAAYSRVGDSTLVSGINLGSLTIAKSYDIAMRLNSISGVYSGSSISRSYTYDTVGRRTKAITESNESWNYAYDSKSQLTSGIKKNASELTMPGMSFAYEYDDIGNRKTDTRNSAVSTYSANNLNQYTERTVPGKALIAGSADSSATIMLQEGENAAEKLLPVNGYFTKELVFDNSTAPVDKTYKVHAFKAESDKEILDSKELNIVIPKTPEVYSYDADGNLLSDGRFSYTWDAENRLTKAENATLKVEFAYDYASRRISKKVYRNAVLSSYIKFVYDGWNLIAELDGSSNTLLKSYVWGEDLSGSLQGAGGVGGLLAVKEASEVFYPAYDGNGNILAYIDATGAKVAEFDYNPFGRVSSKAGTKANDFNFQFSTKYLDNETGFSYYGYRYYSSDLGRWINRDKLGEIYYDTINRRAELNPILMFAKNNSISFYDILGLFASGGHKFITTWAYNNMEDCAKANGAFDKIMEENSNTDSGDNYNNMALHFNRTPETSYEDAKKAYSKELAAAEKSFNDALEKCNCDEALKQLGRLTHMWQDYYGHGVVGNGKLGILSGNPKNPTLNPSSFPGEHPKLCEPCFPDVGARKEAAMNYTKENMEKMMKEWKNKCGK